jgi:AcrR family transcriptional regulator
MSRGDDKRPGRPRSQAAHQAILVATLDLLRTTGVRELTIEGIARAAGVGKPTIYRWWPSKNALVIEAVFGAVADEVAFPVAATVETALVAQVRVVAELLAGDAGRLLAELVGEAQSDPETLRSIDEQFVSVRRNAARELIRHGQQSGEIAADVDPDAAIDLIYGPLYYRLLFRHLPIDREFADAIVHTALHGLSADI